MKSKFNTIIQDKNEISKLWYRSLILLNNTIMYTEERKCDNNWNKEERFQKFRKKKIVDLFLGRQSVCINFIQNRMFYRVRSLSTVSSALII